MRAPFPVILLGLLLTLLVGSLASPDCAQISYLEQGVEYQKVLLDYYSRQLIAHGAMLFAASAATFRFMTGFIDRTSKHFASGVVFVFLAGLLLSVCTYLGLRVVAYGAWAHGVINYP